jgi:hypothetical protein
MPRIIQLTPDGGGRYIAVDRDGDLWRGETKRQKEGGEEYIQWTPLPAQFPRVGNPMNVVTAPFCLVTWISSNPSTVGYEPFPI